MNIFKSTCFAVLLIPLLSIGCCRSNTKTAGFKIRQLNGQNYNFELIAGEYFQKHVFCCVIDSFAAINRMLSIEYEH